MESLTSEYLSQVTEKCSSFDALVGKLTDILEHNIRSMSPVTSELVDRQFLEEIETILGKGMSVYFGQSLRILKCVVTETESARNHEVIVRYKGPRKLSIISMGLPHSPLYDMEFPTLEELLDNIKNKIDSLSGYFRELEQIDRYCTVMEPVNPTFKEDYRRILLDDRSWLHVEVTPEGLATNVHVVGHGGTGRWQQRLQSGLLRWDHDRDIIENVMDIFDLTEFPTAQNRTSSLQMNSKDLEPPVETVCSICLCSELPDCSGIPLPICQNSICGVYFHRNCLYQWLVACSGGRPPPLGVATGSCPSCLHSIACSEKEQ